MTAQELSTILRHDYKPVIFPINNGGYTIERGYLGKTEPYNDIANWAYADLPKVFRRDTLGAIVRCQDRQGPERLAERAERHHDLNRINHGAARCPRRGTISSNEGCRPRLWASRPATSRQLVASAGHIRRLIGHRYGMAGKGPAWMAELTARDSFGWSCSIALSRPN